MKIRSIYFTIILTILFSSCDKVFNDNHVALMPTDARYPFFQLGILGKIDTINDFDLEILKDNYLTEAKFENPFFTYGILEDNIRLHSYRRL